MSYKGTSKWNGVFKKDDVFGLWTVIDEIVLIERESKLKCRCSCGFEKYVEINSLRNGKSLGCKYCKNSTDAHIGSKNGNWKGVGNIPRSYFTRMKNRARNGNITWNLDINDLNLCYISQKEKCALTGLPIKINETASLDRIDSSKGYEIDNVQWVHKDVNVMKNGYDQTYFINFCHLVSQLHEKPTTINNTFKFGHNK